MEPERKIEKLLRAYAKKRRADAGDALKLHPATRKFLQSEVARNKSRPDEEDEESLSLWELFRRQWAFLAVFAVMVFFGAALFLPALSSAKKKAQSVTAMSSLKQIGMAAQMAAEENNGRLPASLDALTNQLGSDTILTDTVSGRRFVYIAGGEDLDGLSSNAVLAYSPTDKKGHAVLFADGRVEVVKGDRLAGLTNRGQMQLASAKDVESRQLQEAPATMTVASGSAVAALPAAEPLKSEAGRSDVKLADSSVATGSAGELAANKPAAPAVPLERLAKAPAAADQFASTQTNTVTFASVAARNPALGLAGNFKSADMPARDGPVLANFQVQQNGDAIRIVDGDGSVYAGSLLPAAPAATPPPAVTAPAPVEREKVNNSPEEMRASQSYFFRVSGTNRTLKQNVVFTGNLRPMATVTTNLLQSASGGQIQPVLTNRLFWPNMRIEGTAVIAGTNRIEINATPSVP